MISDTNNGIADKDRYQADREMESTVYKCAQEIIREGHQIHVWKRNKTKQSTWFFDLLLEWVEQLTNQKNPEAFDKSNKRNDKNPS